MTEEPLSETTAPPTDSGPRIEVKLDIFEGPLDLLLHLVKKEKLNIYDIPISRITSQYLEYLELMKTLNVNLASEFLAMAATLLYIKSRMLLPEAFEEDEEDPREDLMRRLLEHQLYKEAADQLRGLNMLGRDAFTHAMSPEELEQLGTLEGEIEAGFFDLLQAYQEAQKKFPRELHHDVEMEPMTIDQKIEQITLWMETKYEMDLQELFGLARNRFELVLTFIAILELVRRKAIIALQAEAFGAVHIRRRNHGTPGY